MNESKPRRGRSAPLYRSALSPGVGLLLVAPVTFLCLSLATMAVAGGSVLALILPLFVSRRLAGAPRDEDCIVLGPDQYSRIDDEVRRPAPPRLPR